MKQKQNSNHLLFVAIMFISVCSVSSQTKTIQQIQLSDDVKKFKIAAIRQINLIADDIENGKSVKRKLPRIEIELFRKAQDLKRSSGHYVAIGDQFFNPGGRGCEKKPSCIMVVMTLEEFESLKDNSLVTYHIGAMINPAIMEEYDKSGRLHQIVPTYDRLDKTMLDKSSSIERNVVQQ